MFKVYKNLGWFFKQEWKKYIFMAFLLIILAFMTTIPGKLLGDVIDAINNDEITFSKTIIFFISLLIIPIVRYGLDFTYHYLVNVEGQKLAYLLRQRYLDHLFLLDSKLYEKYTKGDLIARVTTDLDALMTAATTLLQEIVYQSAAIISTVVMMITLINLKLTIATVFIMPIALSILNVIRSRMRRYYKIHKKIYSRMTERVLESVEGVKVVRAYVNEDRDLEELADAINADINSWRKTIRFESIFTPLFELVYWISYIIAFAYGIYLVINQEISIGSMITFNVYLGSLYAPIMAIGNIYNAINNAIIADERYNEIMETLPEVKDQEQPTSIMTFKTIKFNNVSFKYPFDLHNVINNITFTINNGETIGIVGKTGAGKSTLIRQLLREFNITEGSILIDNIPIEDYKIEDIRTMVGYVPQSHVLFSKTATENILVGNDNASKGMIKTAIKVADFEKDIPFLADGLDTIVGESGKSLSGGQKQRLSIARAIIKDPQILILDDSLSAVDATTEKNIIHNIKETRQGKTNIIIAHRFSAIKDADKILVLDDGKIAGLGTHQQLMETNEWYKHQFHKQNYMGGDDND